MLDEDIAYYPELYNENYLFLLEVDPAHLHIFWEIIPKSVSFKTELFLTLYYTYWHPDEGVKNNSLKLLISETANDLFVEIKERVIECHAEIGYMENGAFFTVCNSKPLEIQRISEIKMENNKIREIGHPRKDLSTVEVEAKSSNFNDDLVFTNLKELKRAKYTHDLTESKDGLNTKEDLPLPKIHKKEKRVESKSAYLEKIITKEKIIDYYKNLPKRFKPNPGFTPWKHMLDNMNHIPFLRHISLINIIDSLDVIHSENESHFSYFGKD